MTVAGPVGYVSRSVPAKYSGTSMIPMKIG